MIHPAPIRLLLFCARLLIVVAIFAHVHLLAQTTATGTLEGRVFNPTTGENLELARITVEGTSLETLTDASGQYRLANVPAGPVRVRAFRTGIATQTISVVVTSAQVAIADIELGASRGPSDGTVRLAQFTVGASKEMDGAAIAIN